VNEYFAKTLRSEDHMDLIRQLLDKTKYKIKFTKLLINKV